MIQKTEKELKQLKYVFSDDELGELLQMVSKVDSLLHSIFNYSEGNPIVLARREMVKICGRIQTVVNGTRKFESGVVMDGMSVYKVDRLIEEANELLGAICTEDSENVFDRAISKVLAAADILTGHAYEGHGDRIQTEDVPTQNNERRYMNAVNNTIAYLEREELALSRSNFLFHAPGYLDSVYLLEIFCRVMEERGISV